MKHGKKYNQGAQLVDRAALYEPSEALDIAVKTATAKFDETVEVHIRLGVDSRHADQQVRGAVVLPNGTGKKVRVAVFAKGADAEAATAAGAEIVGAEKLGENFNTLLDAIVKAKPASSKGQYIKSCVVASTMGPGIRINPSKVLNAGSAE